MILFFSYLMKAVASSTLKVSHSSFLLEGWSSWMVQLPWSWERERERERERATTTHKIEFLYIQKFTKSSLTDVTTYPGSGRAWYALISCNQNQSMKWTIQPPPSPSSLTYLVSSELVEHTILPYLIPHSVELLPLLRHNIPSYHGSLIVCLQLQKRNILF